MFDIFTPITKSWEEVIDKETNQKERFVEVTVSGLSEDRDGERISQKAIIDMITQFKAGTIPFFPNHGKDPNTGERAYRWQDIMGVWVDASQVAENLKAVVRLNKSHEDSEKFWNYVQGGMPIGFSIGGRTLKSEEEEYEDEEEEKSI